MNERPGGHIEEPGPADFRDPLTQRELKRAIIWLGTAVAIVAAWFLAQSILLILGGLVFATMLDGGARLLGRVLPIGRGWRLAIICIAFLAFIVWIFYFAGYQLAGQAEALRTVITAQFNRLFGWAQSIGLVTRGTGAGEIGQRLLGSLGQVTAALGNALGAISSLAMIVVIGIFVAIEPRLYERGVAWMLPMERRAAFYETSAKLGWTMRRLMAGRLLGMAVEGVGTWILLALGGVPMAALLGILTGLLAFLPNIGAIVSGVLIVLVGFSASAEAGFWAIAVYVIVQSVDGYLIVPMVAKRSVDLAPALILGAQLLFGALFGILGLALADPIVAMIKVLLEERSGNAAQEAGSRAA
ncbi:AI-2E family transporter [Sphingomonas oleivorans]|uniref:AI-2E family transporter n=1 Tax=Sphingomonas oleivorans TaxID=1735121 RepID=A0A2T5FXE1_9SPHN|nr:AI-2E family transporter [Sphingomonas oleivorans]PTQ10807.1 AI-2E family transporter [Sphingomonas oleivorans]